MRRTLGTLLLLATLAACGSESESGPGSAGEGTPDGGGDPGWSQVAVLSASDAGGEVATTATPLPDEAAVAAFAGGFDERLGAQVVEAAAAAVVPEGQQLYGAVVGVGCEPPTAVTVTPADDVVVEAVLTGKPGEIQCLVPVTTVALVLA